VCLYLWARQLTIIGQKVNLIMLLYIWDHYTTIFASYLTVLLYKRLKKCHVQFHVWHKAWHMSPSRQNNYHMCASMPLVWHTQIVYGTLYAHVDRTRCIRAIDFCFVLPIPNKKTIRVLCFGFLDTFVTKTIHCDRWFCVQFYITRFVGTNDIV